MFRRLILIKVQRQVFQRKRFALHARVAHATYTLHTRTSYITHARAHILLLFYFYFLSLSHSYLIRLYIAPREKERERFFSLSRVYVLHSLSLCRAFLRKPFTPKHARVIVPMRCSLIRMSAWSFLALFLSTCSSSSSD